MILLSIDGRELNKLVIESYTPNYQLLDGEATNRTRAPGWELIREPQGVICNFAIEIFRPDTTNQDFVYFMDKYFSLGKNEFVRVIHRDMLGRVWNQEMYYVVDGVSVRRFEGKAVFTDNVNARFIAKKGQV